MVVTLVVDLIVDLVVNLLTMVMIMMMIISISMILVGRGRIAVWDTGGGGSWRGDLLVGEGVVDKVVIIIIIITLLLMMIQNYRLIFKYIQVWLRGKLLLAQLNETVQVHPVHNTLLS